MKVKDVMQTGVASCSPDTNLAAVVEILWKNDCGAVPVLSDGKLQGVITDRDIAIALGTRNLPAGVVSAGEVIRQEIFTCAPDDDVQQALKTMRTHKVRRLPVVGSHGALQGILCLNDVVLRSQRMAHKSADVTYEDVVNTLKAIGEHRTAGSRQSVAAVAVG